jgi:sphingomyelin phosphodiesterase acid-like 3
MSGAARAQSAMRATGSRPQTVQALFVSDIHFEPFRDPSKAERLKAAPVRAWNAILVGPEAADRGERWAAIEKACPTRGEDSTFQLYESSLRAIRKNASRAKFIVVSGDLISHSFSCKYAALFPKAAPGDYRVFVEKTIAFVVGSLRETLPGVPVYAALGNNDSDCGDYQLDAGGDFLAAEADEFTRGFSSAEREQAERTFAAGGYYSVSLPAPMRGTKLLVLDDLFMSRRYETCGGNEDRAPAEQQVTWLEQQLTAARGRDEKIWVMAHIPPGVDPYSTATKGKNICETNKPTMFLSSEALPKAMAKYGDVIKLAIFAHTHMDEMRLLEPAEEGTARSGVAVKMAPSISPVDGNNPAFTVAAIDPATAVMKDYRVIAASHQTGVDTTWAEEYDFASVYKEPAFSAASVEDLIGRFEADRSAQTNESQSYIQNYDVGQPMRELGPLWPAYVCAMKNDSGEAFTKCVCGK